MKRLNEISKNVIYRLFFRKYNLFENKLIEMTVETVSNNRNAQNIGGCKMQYFKKSVVITLALMLTFSTLATAESRERFDRTIDASNVDAIEIMNINGKVEIESWSGDDIEINAVKKTRSGQSALDKVEIKITTGSIVTVKTVKDGASCGNTTFFQGLFRNMFSGGGGVSVDYEIKIPESVALKLAKSTNGYVSVRNVDGEMQLKSTNGNINAENCQGEVTANTTNGSIFVSGGSNVVSAHTTNGKIDVSLPNEINSDMRFRTTNGSIILHLDMDVNARLKCRTTNGRISASGFRMIVNNISKRNLDGTLGDGGSLIDASTTNGGITILEN